MAELTAKLPLTDDLKNALNERTGPLAPYLQAVIAYERGEFQACTDHLRLLGIAPETIINAYFKALAWADLFDANLA
jgi:EAL and modified HD-GYP domain-containing signal transduction protein